MDDSQLVIPGWRTAPGHSPDTIKKLERAMALVASHSFIEPACKVAGISKQTFYKFKDQYPDFAEELSEAVHAATIELGRAAYACALKAEDDPKYLSALIFACKARLGWSDQLKVTHEGGENPIQHKLDIDLSKLTPEQLKAIIEGGDNASRAQESSDNGGANGDGTPEPA